ncbi:MAG: hypothetical protein A4E47_01661 [Methanosaeta sp. PtaU1.Bin028]|nr:MAG: hypothetical protein A4E47_01661 [Methanosaeta sp. PtaU1.Bin028]
MEAMVVPVAVAEMAATGYGQLASQAAGVAVAAVEMGVPAERALEAMQLVKPELGAEFTALEISA